MTLTSEIDRSNLSSFYRFRLQANLKHTMTNTQDQ